MNAPTAQFWGIRDVESSRSAEGAAYREFLRVPSMSAGVYVLGAGSVDTQTPHRQDELYFVAKGRARMRAGDLDQEVGQGSLIFVAASVAHQFYDIREELTILVFFAPAESS